MSKMSFTAYSIRKAFLDFFESKTHKIVPAAPIVNKDDPTLMFTNAGMNQFKDSFLGIKQPPAPRVADTQSCLRVSGKHNDLEEVGHDTYHHTMFEMLGNWSFGDYYKKEAIDWAWELLTEVYKIDPARLYVTIFEGNEADGLPLDKEAQEEWKKWMPEDRILPYDKKDNFWEMGDTGPCGPCSEIHIDLRDEEERQQVDGRTLVNADHPLVVEIWNLVFMEFNRKADGSLENLPSTHVDTGMGFERLCMVLQGVKSNYDTDVFTPYRDYLEKELGCDYSRSEEEAIAMRVVMDHLRAVTFAIADGQLPSNTGAGYVIRRILRRASRYGFQYLNQTRPFIYRMIPLIADFYKGVFDGIAEQKEFLSRIIEEEEKSFLRTLEQGTKIFDEYVADHKDSKEIDGEFVFLLKDRYGFPEDLTALMAKEIGWEADMEGFRKFLKEQQERGKEAAETKRGDWTVLIESNDPPEFIGYDHTEAEVNIREFRTISTKKKDIYQIVLDRTPFYAESGGQVGDKGTISGNGEEIRVLDTQKENDLIVHVTDKLPKDPSGAWLARVNTERRRLIKANHSATHLLHAALREVLGDHVEQRGSLVSDEVLRFDFSHFSRMEEEEIAKVEAIVNEKIAAGISLDEKRNIPISKAKEMGAMALFGEKYGDEVRVIVFDPEYSVELCGGTHVKNTSEIRLFKLVTESSIAAGVRRVEAYTSDKALEWLNDRSNVLGMISETLKGAKDPVKAVEDLIEKQKELEKSLEKLNREKVGGLKDGLKGKVKTINGLNLLNEVIEIPSANDMRSLCFDLRKGMENTLIVLGAIVNEKPLLNVIMTEDLQKEGKYNATQFIRELAKEIQGGGGGQDFFASAGGKNPGGIPAAVKKAEELV